MSRANLTQADEMKIKRNIIFRQLSPAEVAYQFNIEHLNHLIKTMSYCSAIEYMVEDKKALHKAYHDKLYGFPIHEDNELFCRLVLEINQAGLSWETILKKETTFRKAYNNFNIEKVAAYTEADRERLLADPGIIRNRLKINAAIENARTILQLQKEFGSFENWLENHHPKSKEEWVKVFKKTFKFTGGEIVNEFLMSTGYLEGAHSSGCKIYEVVLKARPMWSKTI
ncbi:MAG: methyladenine glycosylase [Segetibacter sp.]|nr:methyladenine glycosylase [Segetibacter sp.]